MRMKYKATVKNEYSRKSCQPCMQCIADIERVKPSLHWLLADAVENFAIRLLLAIVLYPYFGLFALDF